MDKKGVYFALPSGMDAEVVISGCDYAFWDSKAAKLLLRIHTTA